MANSIVPRRLFGMQNDWTGHTSNDVSEQWGKAESKKFQPFPESDVLGLIGEGNNNAFFKSRPRNRLASTSCNKDKKAERPAK